jgi:hypothetical protein
MAKIDEKVLNEPLRWSRHKTKALSVVSAISGFFDSMNSVDVNWAIGAVNHPYALLGVFLAYEAFKSIRACYKGDISGKRCVGEIVDSLASATGAVGGGMIGKSIGAIFGPIPMVIGAIAGAYIGSNISGNLSNTLSSELFDLPKDVALENASKSLGLSHKATNQEINSHLRFRKLCLEYHSDKGGSAEKFHQLQCSMSVIKISKGEVN